MIESTVECAILVELIVPSFFCAACEKRFAVYILSDDKPARRLANCPLCGAFAIRDGSQRSIGAEAPRKAEEMLSRISKLAAAVDRTPSGVKEAMRVLREEQRMTQEKLDRTATI